MPTTVLFIRHGENPANLTGELSHRDVDYSLTERGRRQAQAVAEHLAAKQIPVLLTSTMDGPQRDWEAYDGNYALAAARALDAYEEDAEEIARRAMAIAAEVCVFTNDRVTVETV